MNVKILKDEALFDYLIEIIKSDFNDYSKNIIIFPGKRPSYFLLHLLSKINNGPFIPPTIFSMDEFIDYCYLHELKIIDRKIDILSACKVLRSLLKDEKVYPQYVDDLNLFLPLVFKIFSAFEELLIEGITPSKLAPQDLKIEAKFFPETMVSLSKLYEKFYQNLEKNGFSTRSMRYKKVSETKVSLYTYEKIIFAGFFALTTCERNTFMQFKDDGRTFFVFQDDCSKEYALYKTYNPPELKLDAISIYECPNTHAEVFMVSNLLLKDIKENGNSDSYLIISPTSDSLMPLINSLPLSMDDYNVSLGYPLNRTPLYTFIQTIFKAVCSKIDGKYYIPDYLNFILHPYTKNILYENEAEFTRYLFHNIEDHLLKTKFVVYRDLIEIENLLDTIPTGKPIEKVKDFIKKIHKNTLHLFEEIYNIADFASKLKKLINFIYENSTAKKHILFFPFCEAMLDALTELENSLIASEKFNELHEYFDFFKKFIALYKVPFKGTPIKNIQILGFLESRNLTFDNVYILDVNEDIIPSAEKEDDILPLDVRKILGLPTYIEKSYLFDYYLRTTINKSKKTYIFYIENDEKTKSRLVEKIIWEKQKKTKSIDDNYFKTVSYKFSLKPYKPQVVPKTEQIYHLLRGFTYSATSIDTYFQCPLKFYYEYLLFPSESKEYEDLENKDVGTLVHDLLRLYFEKKNDIEFDESIFDSVLDEIFKKNFGTEQRGKVLILKHQIKFKIGAFISNYRKITNCDKIKIISLEQTFETKTKISEQSDVTIKGRIDRIEERDGKIFIIDYKTASDEDRYKVKWDKFTFENRSDWKRAFKTLQLPFYMFLMNRCNQGYKVDNASIFLLGIKDIFNCEIKLFNESDKSSYQNCIDDIIQTLLKEIIEDCDYFSPTEDLKLCEKCTFKAVCWR